MTYSELCEAILTAQEEMLKYKIEANSVTLNGRRYGKLIENCPPNMKPTIFGMTVKADCSMPDDYDFLVQYEPPQPQTNYDLLISKTPEELAEWIAYNTSCETCPVKNATDYECHNSNCGTAWGLWLKAPVEEVDNADN